MTWQIKEQLAFMPPSLPKNRLHETTTTDPCKTKSAAGSKEENQGKVLGKIETANIMMIHRHCWCRNRNRILFVVVAATSALIIACTSLITECDAFVVAPIITTSSAMMDNYDRRWWGQKATNSPYGVAAAAAVVSKSAAKHHFYEFRINRRPTQYTSHHGVRLYQTSLSSSSSSNNESTTPTNNSNKEKESIRVGIVGAGAIALGTASILSKGGHLPMIWSPSGSGTKDLVNNNNSEKTDDGDSIVVGQEVTATGAMDEYTFTPRIATSAKQLVETNDVIIIAIPANGHKYVFDEIAPYIRRGKHHIIISSHASFGALYLSERIREYHTTTADDDDDGMIVPITAWGTTVCTARTVSSTNVRVNTIRQSVDMCCIPQSRTQTSLELCITLFGHAVAKFVERDGLLAISLSNLNPQNHLGIVLGNISRMEKGEDWYQLVNITPTIGRLLESLDSERLDIAQILGLNGLKTIYEHFSLSFHVPMIDETTGKQYTISEMNQQINQLGNDVYGPKTSNSRYVTEDVPFGLVPTIVLGQLVEKRATLHESGVQLISAMYGRSFIEENDLLPALQLDQYTLEEIQEASKSGILRKKNEMMKKETRKNSGEKKEAEQQQQQEKPQRRHATWTTLQLEP